MTLRSAVPNADLQMGGDTEGKEREDKRYIVAMTIVSFTFSTCHFLRTLLFSEMIFFWVLMSFLS